MVGSKDTELSTLIVTNSQLTATNASLTGQLLEMVGLQERVGTLQDENARLLDEVGGLRQQNADLSSAKWAMEQEVRLAGAQRSAKRQRKVVMLGAMGTAWLGCTIGIVLLVLNILDIIPGPLGPYFFIMGAFPNFALLTLQPNDEKRIRMRAALWCGTIAGLGINPAGIACGIFIAFGVHHDTFCPFERALCTFSGVGGLSLIPVMTPMLLVTMLPMLKRKPEAIAARPFKASLREARQAAIAKAGPAIGSVAFALFPGTFWCMSEMEHGAFAMSSRVCLERLWILPRVFGFIMMVTIIIATTATFLIHPQQPEGSNLTATVDGVEYVYMSQDAFWQILSLVIAFAVQVPLGAMWTPKNRARIAARLNAIAVRGEAGRAAAVAAIIGDSDPQKVLALARRSFRGLPLALLRRSDLEVSADTGLNAKTQRCRLGEVDAFVSHSWSDDPAAKWRVLQAWGAAFEERTGGGAIIWLDKACIDQTKIDDNLACLPVHLAGCKSLLVLAGPTYTKRLWCILEVFTFLKAGGGFDALELVPIAADADDGGEGGGGGGRLGFEAVRAAFLKFSVEDARCYKEDERQHLLGVVETGFGSLDTFDELVRSLFAESLEKGASFKLEPGKGIELPPSPPPGPPGKLEC